MVYIGRDNAGSKYRISGNLVELGKFPEPMNIPSTISPEALERLIEFLNKSGGYFSFRECDEAEVSAGVGKTDSWYYIVLSGEIDDTLKRSGPFFRGYNEQGVFVETGFHESHRVKPITDVAIVLHMKSINSPQGLVYFLRRTTSESVA